MPAVFKHKQDSLGFRWDVCANGQVSDGTSDCFDGGLVLIVGGNQFNPQKQMMTPDGREYVVSATMSGVEVERRVLVDTARSVVRYMEVFENSGNAEVSLAVIVKSTLGGSCRGVLTSSGANFTGSLGKKDVGLVSISSSNRPCVMFLVSGPRDRSRPRVNVQNNRTFSFTYTLKIKPRKKASIVHLVAQRRGVGAANAAALFGSFYKRGRLVKPGMPRHLAKTVVNFRRGWPRGDTEAEDMLADVRALADMADVERGLEDVLVLGEEGHVRGVVECRGLSVATVHGETRLGLKEVALMVGGAGTDRPQKTYLRNGEVLAGPVRASGLRFNSESGLKMDLDPSRIGMLFTHASPDDGKTDPSVRALVGTRVGDRLAVRRTDSRIEAATPWGPLEVALGEVERLCCVRDPQPCHRISLADGAVLPVILTSPGPRIETFRFGPVTFPPGSVASLARVRAGPPQGAGREVPAWEREIRDRLAEEGAFDIPEKPVHEMMAVVQGLGAVNVVIDPEAESAKVSCKAAKARLGKALEAALEPAGLGYVLVDGALFVAKTDRLEELEERIADAGGPEPDREKVPAAELKLRKRLERLVSFEFTDTPLGESVQFFGKLSRVKASLGEELDENDANTPITLKVTNMSADLALGWIARLAGLDWVFRKGEIALVPPLREGARDGDAGGEGAISEPHLLLASDHVLVGAIDAAEFEVVTSAGPVPVDPLRISTMARGDEDGPGGEPLFVFELADGSSLTGRVAGGAFRVRRGERVFAVPARQVIEGRGPKASRVTDDGEEAGKADGEEDGSELAEAKRLLADAGLDPGLLDGITDEERLSKVARFVEVFRNSRMSPEAKAMILARFLETLESKDKN